MNPTVPNGEGVTCRKLVKEYRRGEARVPALRGVDLELHPGELALLVGPAAAARPR